jgi:hypothetical protein
MERLNHRPSAGRPRTGEAPLQLADAREAQERPHAEEQDPSHPGASVRT